jgi:hypothetical protein
VTEMGESGGDGKSSSSISSNLNKRGEGDGDGYWRKGEVSRLVLIVPGAPIVLPFAEVLVFGAVIIW